MNRYFRFAIFLILFLVLHFLRSSVGISPKNELPDINEAFEYGLETSEYKLTDGELNEIGSKMQEAFKIYETLGSIELEMLTSLVYPLFRDGRLQEGIWILDNFGYYDVAERLSLRLEHYLISHPLVAGEYVAGGGASEPRWGKAGVFPVIIKREDNSWRGAMAAESWVYHLDRILGLNLVPLTFTGAINGYAYSGQVVIKGSHDSEIEFRMSNYTGRYPDLFILDFLIRNRDRRGSNSLITPLNTFVAIDNGRAAVIPLHQEAGKLWETLYPHYEFSQLPRSNLVSTISEVNIDEFILEFSKYAPSGVVKNVANNLSVLKNDFLKLAHRKIYRPITSNQRLNWPTLLNESVQINTAFPLENGIQSKISKCKHALEVKGVRPRE